MDQRLTIGPWIGNPERLPSALGGLDTWELTRCTRLIYDDGEGAPTLELTLEGPKARIRLQCEGVASVEIPPWQTKLWLPQFEIWDVQSAGMEGIRFRLQTDEDIDGFRCHCLAISLIEAVVVG